MKIIYIIILIILIFLISKKENFLSSDFIINNFPGEINESDYNNIFINNNFNVSKELKVFNTLESNITNVSKLNLVNTDIRIYLTGMTGYVTNNNNVDIKNSFIKKDYPIGTYSRSVSRLNDGGIINIIVIYPGFGVFMYEEYGTNPDKKCEIYNYGRKPLKIKLGSPITVIGSSDNQSYNSEPGTYHIGTYRNMPQIFEFKVFLVELDKWVNHSHNY